MSLAPPRPLTMREQWLADTEAVTRSELLAMVNVAMATNLRTRDEQDALLVLINRLDAPGFTSMGQLRFEAVDKWVKASICECGSRTSQYWCSQSCFRSAEPLEDFDDDA